MHRNRFGGMLTIVAIATAMGWLNPATASVLGLSLSIQNGLSAPPGSFGNSFEVEVTNNGSSADIIDSFAFEVSVSNPSIILTTATYGTTDIYIFNADSLFGPTLSTLSPGSSMDASDISASGTDYTLGVGKTVAIGEVFYNVLTGTAAASYSVTFSPTSATSFSDASGNTFLVGAFNAGVITVSNAGIPTVPEPSSISSMALVGLFLGAYSVHRKKLFA